MPAEYQTAKEARRDTARLKRAEFRSKGKAQQEARTSAINKQMEERAYSEKLRQNTQYQRSRLREEEVSQRASSRIQTQKELSGERRQERATNAVLFGGANKVASSSIGQNIGILVALFFAMLILYHIVTNGPTFGKLTGSVATFIRGLTSNTVLFVKTDVSTDNVHDASAILGDTSSTSSSSSSSTPVSTPAPINVSPTPGAPRLM